MRQPERSDPGLEKLMSAWDWSLAPVREEIQASTLLRRQLLQSSRHVKIARALSTWFQESIGLCALVALAGFLITGWRWCLQVAGTWVCGWVAAGYLEQKFVSDVLLENGGAMTASEKAAVAASETLTRIEEDYQRQSKPFWDYSASHSTDWNRRRSAVLRRDGYACTQCGWPSGFQRRARELQVHRWVSAHRLDSGRLRSVGCLRSSHQSP